MREKSTLLTISLPSSLLERIETQAKEKGQSVSECLRGLMKEILEAQTSEE